MTLDQCGSDLLAGVAGKSDFRLEAALSSAERIHRASAGKGLPRVTVAVG
jgi:hypothetical protein